MSIVGLKLYKNLYELGHSNAEIIKFEMANFLLSLSLILYVYAGKISKYKQILSGTMPEQTPISSDISKQLLI